MGGAATPTGSDGAFAFLVSKICPRLEEVVRSPYAGCCVDGNLPRGVYQR
jgi:hypothetical protein